MLINVSLTGYEDVSNSGSDNWKRNDARLRKKRMPPMTPSNSVCKGFQRSWSCTIYSSQHSVSTTKNLAAAPMKCSIIVAAACRVQRQGVVLTFLQKASSR